MSAQETSSPATSGAEARCLLTLVLPLALEEAVLDLLQASPELDAGYTVVPAQGLGAGATLSSVMEQVQGRARRVLVQAVLKAADVPAVLARLQTQIRSPQVSYWVQALLAGGTLA